MHEKIRTRILELWARSVSRHPRGFVLLGVAMAVLAILITVFGIPRGPVVVPPLAFQSDRNDLLSPDIEWNQWFIRWQETFPGHSDLVIAIDGYGKDQTYSTEDRLIAQEVTDTLAAELTRYTTGPQRVFERVIYGYDPAEVSPAAIRMENMEDFQRRLAQIRSAELMLQSPTLQTMLTAAMQQAAGALAGGDSPRDPSATTPATASTSTQGEYIAQFATLIDGIGAFLQAEQPQSIDFADLLAANRGNESVEQSNNQWHYLTSENNRLFFIFVTPVLQEEELSPAEVPIAVIRDVMGRVGEQFPTSDFGLTGVEVVESEETAAAMYDSARASVIAITLIAIVLVVAFHSFRIPLLAIFALLIGIAWSFGFLTLAIGHLQVLSVVFTVVLLGLGIDFGIHLIARYELVRHSFADTSSGFADAMAHTFQSVGPGLLTGALTTTAAFATVSFSDFEGLAEMGLIAMAGILLCLISMLLIFPALLRIYKRRHRHVKPLEERWFHFFEDQWVLPFSRHPQKTLVVVLVATILGGLGMSQIRFDYNLINLLPNNTPSVTWQRRIAGDGGNSLWYGVSITDSLEKARVLAAELRKKPTVKDVGGIGLLFPEKEAEKTAQIRSTRGQIEKSLQIALADTQIDQPPLGSQPEPDLIVQLAGIRNLLGYAQATLPTETKPQITRLSQTIDRVVAVADGMPPELRRERLLQLRQDYRRWRLVTARSIDQALTDRPLEPNDLPAPIRSWYVAADRYALEIYPDLPPGITDPLNPAFLGRFVADIEEVDPAATGSCLQIYRSGQLIWSSFRNAGVVALIAVFVLVLLDFRNVADACMALLPVLVGFIWTFGVMYLIGENINPANIMVLPLMFGIGIDAGVHIIHRYRDNPTDRPLGLAGGTGKGITMTSLTTMIGFASMIPAQHRGIKSLGIVLTLGIGFTLLCSWVAMPAWLELRTRRKEAKLAKAIRRQEKSYD